MTNERLIGLSLANVKGQETVYKAPMCAQWPQNAREMVLVFHQNGRNTASARLIALGSRLVGFGPPTTIFACPTPAYGSLCWFLNRPTAMAQRSSGGRTHQPWQPARPIGCGRYARCCCFASRHGLSHRRCKRVGSMRMVGCHRLRVPVSSSSGFHQGL